MTICKQRQREKTIIRNWFSARISSGFIIEMFESHLAMIACMGNSSEICRTVPQILAFSFPQKILKFDFWNL